MAELHIIGGTIIAPDGGFSEMTLNVTGVVVPSPAAVDPGLMLPRRTARAVAKRAGCGV